FSFCFFFSSRRRHTRFSRDWSSDVCSSDLMFATINDWLNVVMLFHRVEPLLQSDFKAVHRLIGRVGFYIQHRSQISRFELHISDKILSLQQAVFIGAVKMVSTPNK